MIAKPGNYIRVPWFLSFHLFLMQDKSAGSGTAFIQLQTE